MNTLAEFKRRMTVGRTVTVVNHAYPELSGERQILAARQSAWQLSFPKGHPRHAPGEGSWVHAPKKADCTFAGDAITILWEEGWTQAGQPFCTITVPA